MNYFLQTITNGFLERYKIINLELKYFHITICHFYFNTKRHFNHDLRPVLYLTNTKKVLQLNLI